LIHLYKTRPSDTAIALVKAKAIRRIIPGKSKPTLVLNYGATKPLPNYNGRYLNHPKAVQAAADKIKTFQLLTEANIPTVPWTTNRDEALEWITKNKAMVVARTLTRASEGRGAVFTDHPELLVPAPLYTRYIKKQAEFRVNVAFGTIINIRQKRRRTDFEGEVNNLCRSHANGWVFCSEGVDKSNPILCSLALNSISAVRLDFGAVDIIYNAHYNSYFVLEVNSAPGMEGETLTNFIEALKNVR
jgi:hypothetical protein